MATTKRITKKEIERTLRTMDSTQIYRLYHKFSGEKPEKIKVHDFICEYAPNQKVLAHVWDLSFPTKHSIERINIEDECLRKHGRYTGDQKKRIVDFLKEQVKDPQSNYAKRPMLGRTGLYFCSPAYGHGDYNKWRACDINGNEEFCMAVIKYADKFFGPIYDN